MRIEHYQSITSISAQLWDSLFASRYPFMQHAFLAALEQSKAVCAQQGWQPHHLVVLDNDTPVAVMPWYLKSHSFGEYMFDWNFAEAYQRYQLEYYPKLVSAVPFTPASGPRIGIASGYTLTQVWPAIHSYLANYLQQHALSGYQCLYLEPALATAMTNNDSILRSDVQFHWHRRNYQTFDDFLEQLTSRKRKMIRKERQRVAAQGIHFQHLAGSDITPAHWHQFYKFYCATYLKRSGHLGYLNEQTFRRWGDSMPDNLIMVGAIQNDQWVAAALFFKSDTTLYGRYWGALEEFDFLHFETCYYQGIDICIAKGLDTFDAGAQGEHKLQRGFEPVLRQGCYFLAESPLLAAIKGYCEQERQHTQAYLEAALQALPYRHDD